MNNFNKNTIQLYVFFGFLFLINCEPYETLQRVLEGDVIILKCNGITSTTPLASTLPSSSVNIAAAVQPQAPVKTLQQPYDVVIQNDNNHSNNNDEEYDGEDGDDNNGGEDDVDDDNVDNNTRKDFNKLHQYLWIHNGKPIINTSRIYQIGADLYFNTTYRTVDNGYYQCMSKRNVKQMENGNGNMDNEQILSNITLEVNWLNGVSVHKDHTAGVSNGNSHLILKCHIDGYGSNVKIEWQRNGKRLKTNKHQKIHSVRLTFLHKPPGHVLDNATYSCTGTINQKIVYSTQNYTLNINDIIDNDFIHKNHHHKDNKQYSIKYLTEKMIALHDMDGGEAASIKSAVDQESVQKNINIQNNEMYLYRLKRGDDQIDDDSALNNIIKLPITQLSIDEDKSVSMHCDLSVKGSKKTMHLVKWLRDGKPFRQTGINVHAAALTSSPAATSSSSSLSSPSSEIMSSDTTMPREDARIIINQKNGSVTFTSVISSDSGVYECQVFNEKDLQTSMKKTELKIIEQLKFVPQPTSKNLELGTKSKIHCKVQGTPTPNVKWTKENQEELPIDTIEDINGTLVFKNVSITDKGNYTCLAINSQGKIQTTIVIGTVIAPRFLVAPSGPIQATEMTSIMIHCQATGDPKPTIQWDRDLQYISNNNSDSARFHVLENGTLHISEVHLDDEGRYGCTIGSSAGLKREEIRFSVKPANEFANDESGGEESGFMITRAVLITMSVALAYIVLVVGLMLYCRCRRMQRKAQLNLIDKDMLENGGGANGGGGGGGANSGGPNNGDIKMDEIEPCLPAGDKTNNKKINGHQNNKLRNGGSGASATIESNNDTAASTNSKVSKKSNFDQISLSRSCIFDMEKIGCGEFGDIFSGKIKTSDLKPTIVVSEPKLSSKNASNKSINEISIDSGNNTTLIQTNEDDTTQTPSEVKNVLIKALNNVKDENIGIEFRRQIELFRAISHQNVSKLYGLCRDKDPHMLVLESTNQGDLKKYLLTSTPKLSQLQRLRIIGQICRGMDAIYRARYIHKDLAARNCLISCSTMNVKVSYPALSINGYGHEYFRHTNSLIPLRWLAPECLHDDDYSTKSDVFAFGVLVWEIFTGYDSGGGCNDGDEQNSQNLPMNQLSNEEYLQKLKSHTLDFKLAEQTPTELTNILTNCWNNNPKERPSFHTLTSAITACEKSLASAE